MSDLYLQHYGIKGMKWGVRRTPEQLGHRKKASSVTKKMVDDYNRMDDKQFKEKYYLSKSAYARSYQKYNDPHTDHPINKLVYGAEARIKQKQAEKKAKSDAVKEMSDEELRKKLNRIQMEKQYKQLTSNELNAGQKFVKDVMVNSSKQVATQYASKAIVKGVEALIKAAV